MNNNKNTNLLLVERSMPIRKMLVNKFKSLGYDISESVDVVDAIYSLRNEIPQCFILGSDLGQCSAVVLAQRLGHQQKTANIPVIIMAENTNDLQTIEKQPLQESVIPVAKCNSLDGLSEMVIKGLEHATEHVKRCSDNTVEAEETSLEKQHDAEILALEQSFNYLKEIINLVKTHHLPGPLIPGLFTEVRELLVNPEVEFQELANFAAKHPAMVMRLMKIANSAYYFRGVNVTSIDQAIGRIGLEQAGKIFYAVALLAYEQGNNKQLNRIIHANLKKAYLVALLSEKLADLAKFDDCNAVHTIGLLHNVGGTFLLYALSLLQKKGDELVVTSDALHTCMFSHAEELNSLLVKELKLPEELVQIHTAEVPMHASNDEAEHITKIRFVHQAIWLADQLLSSEEPFMYDESAEMFGLSQEVITALNDKRMDMLESLNVYGGD